jgi:acyl-CoA reductase-like NAD-dependent aldehyde dehydrogenase
LLVTARCLDDVARDGLPRAARPPRILHAAAGTTGPESFVAIDVLPEPRLLDGVTAPGQTATVRCANPGGIEAFLRSWREEARERPRGGGVAAVLGAGNVTGLAAADVIAQVFEHGRAALLKLHPLHAPLEPVLRAALGPLVAADLVEIVCGGPETSREAIAAPQVTHVHLTGGQAAFDAVVWGGVGPRPEGAIPVLDKPITCELGNVTPWIVVPGRYTRRQLAYQADVVAASIANNTSFNCIATKCVVTCLSWEQRVEFLGLVSRRLAGLPPRPAWYPGSVAAWEAVTGDQAPVDGTLPWVFRTGVDPAREPRWLAQEWFGPVAVEVPLAADSLDAFCGAAAAFVHALPGNLAASVTAPAGLPAHDEARVVALLEHLQCGVVARNTWSALAYSFASVPWGGFPGGTLAKPGSGLGRVHDPWLLPLVHDAIVTAPLSGWPAPPWVPWHSRGARLARGLIDIYATIARGGTGLARLLAMLPDVLAG